MEILVITPHRSDPCYTAKRHAVEMLSLRYGLAVHYGKCNERTGQFDTDQTIEVIKAVDFLIADLSLERPSCYFEVGYAQALGKKVQFIAKANTVIHQVIQTVSIKFYEDLSDYERLIESLLKDCTKSDGRPS